MRLCELSFCCPRADSSRLFFLDCADEFVVAAELFPDLFAEAPFFSHGAFRKQRFGKSGEIGYELVVVDEWAIRRRLVPRGWFADVKAWNTGIAALGCVGHGTL